MKKNNTLFFLLFVFTIRYPLTAVRYAINFLILLTSFLFNKVLFLKTLFFLEDFFSFKCPVQALLLFICPFFVVLNRFIAPLWLLIFGIYLSFKLIRTQIFADYVQKENSITSGSKLRLSENPIPENFNDSLVSFLILKSSIICVSLRPKRKFLY